MVHHPSSRFGLRLVSAAAFASRPTLRPVFSRRSLARRMVHTKLPFLFALVAPQLHHALATTRNPEAASANVEVVVSHFDEDLTWVKDHESTATRFTVYSKAASPPEFAVSLPNVGRESHTYLHHIVSQYDSLANWTVFTQGIKPTWGYHGGGHASGHLSDAVTFDDYLHPFPDGQDAFFILNAASQFPSGRQTNRLGFMIRDLNEDQLTKDTCPTVGIDGWTPWWWDKKHPQLRSKAKSELTMLEFYHKYIAQDENDGKDLTLAFAQGGRFSVSRDRIHKRPREFYSTLLDQLSTGVSPMAGYWMEASWFDVFHPEALQSKKAACALPATPGGLGLSIVELQNEIVERAKEDGIITDATFRSLTYSSTYYSSDDAAPYVYTSLTGVTSTYQGSLEFHLTQADADAIIAAFNDADTTDAVVAAFADAILEMLDISDATVTITALTWVSGRRLSEAATGYLNVEYQITLPAEYADDFLSTLEDLGTTASMQDALIADITAALVAEGLSVTISGMNAPLVPTEVVPTTVAPASNSTGSSGSGTATTAAAPAPAPDSMAKQPTTGLWAAIIVLAGALAMQGSA